MSLALRMTRLVLLSVLFLTAGGLYSPGFAKDSFALIVNEHNSYSGNRQEMISLIKRLFLKKGKMWPQSDITCRPFDRGANSLEHQRFLESILNLGEGRLAEHWAKMKQLRGDTPPRKINTTRILLKLIQKNKGAFGIVSREDASHLSERVKVLFFF